MTSLRRFHLNAFLGKARIKMLLQESTLLRGIFIHIVRFTQDMLVSTNQNCSVLHADLLTYLLTYLLTHSLHGVGYYLKS